MHLQQTQRLLWRVAGRAMHQHPQPSTWILACTLTRNFAHVPKRVISTKIKRENREVADQQTHESTNTNHVFSAYSLLATNSALAEDTTASKPQVSSNERSRQKKRNKSRADMDHGSFRAQLNEGMRHGNVSSLLRKYGDEIFVQDYSCSDQELVSIVCALIKMNRSERALEVLRSQIKEPNRDRLNRVAAASARMGNFTVALGVLEIVKQFELVPDVITYTSAIHACARGDRSNVSKALSIMNEMIANKVQPNARTYGAMVLAHARLERWDDIFQLMASISYTDDAHKTEVFTCAIISCSRNRQHFYASRLFELLLKDGVYPGDNICNAVLTSCARISDLSLLHRIFKLIKSHATPSIYSYNCMISAYGNVRDMHKALEVFKTLQTDATVSPDIVTYNSLLLAAVRSRKVNLFSTILSSMSEAGIKWDAYTLNTLLEGCALDGDVEMAKYYWSQATRGNQTGADVSVVVKQHITLDRGHYETLMAVHYAANDLRAIVNLWQKSKLCRRRAKSSKALNFLIRACKGLKDAETAVAIMAEFVERGQPLSSITHNHMLEVFLAADNVNAASAHLDKMMESDNLVSTFSFTAFIKYLGKNNHHSNVLNIFDLYLKARELTSKGQNPLLHYPTDAIYMLAMRSAVNLQDHKTVLAIYGHLPAITSMAVRSQLLKLAILSCERVGDWRAAVTMYDEVTGMLDRGTNVELYKLIVKIVASAGEYDRALDVGGGEWYRTNRHDKGWGLSTSS